MKQFIKDTMKMLGLALTRNQQYDRDTSILLKRVLRHSSNCIDIGCHKGEIMDEILELSPAGKHFGFEPIPQLAQILRTKYSGLPVEIKEIALSAKTGTSKFAHVTNSPAFSGLKERTYHTANPEVEWIEVKTDTLDSVIPQSHQVDLIKIDVEGAEFGVLKGAEKTIQKNRPFIIFESGLGASDHYGTTPEDLYTFVTNRLGLQLSTMRCFLDGASPLTLKDFEERYLKNGEYYWLAYS